MCLYDDDPTAWTKMQEDVREVARRRKNGKPAFPEFVKQDQLQFFAKPFTGRCSGSHVVTMTHIVGLM